MNNNNDVTIHDNKCYNTITSDKSSFTDAATADDIFLHLVGLLQVLFNYVKSLTVYFL